MQIKTQIAQIFLEKVKASCIVSVSVIYIASLFTKQHIAGNP